VIGLVLVGHSRELVDGLRAMIAQSAPGVPVRAAGGTEEGRLGTSAPLVEAALREALAEAAADDVVVLFDLGSAVLAVEVGIESLTDVDRRRVRASGAPLVEGAVLAAVAARGGGSIADVLAAADGAAAMAKLPDDWPG